MNKGPLIRLRWKSVSESKKFGTAYLGFRCVKNILNLGVTIYSNNRFRVSFKSLKMIS
jgi:hypothetical protein